MVMVGLMERKILNGKLLDEERVVYLRGTSEVDAGSRFTDGGLPEKINLSPRAFLDAFESAVKASIKTPGDSIDKMKKNEEAAAKKKAEIARRKEMEKAEKEAAEAKRSEYIERITSNLINASDEIKAKFKEKVVATGCKNIKDEDMPIDVLVDIVKLIEG